jgi:hypothetical protein
MLSLDFLFDRINSTFASCQASPNKTRVGDYMVTSFGGGFNGHIHAPTEIKHEDNSFKMSPAYAHNHNVEERVKITKEGEFVSTVDGLHSHKWSARKMGVTEKVVDGVSSATSKCFAGTCDGLKAITPSLPPYLQ